jgi:hypothetical protein
MIVAPRLNKTAIEQGEYGTCNATHLTLNAKKPLDQTDALALENTLYRNSIEHNRHKKQYRQPTTYSE